MKKLMLYSQHNQNKQGVNLGWYKMDKFVIFRFFFFFFFSFSKAKKAFLALESFFSL